MSIELAVLLAVAAFTGIATLGHVFVFGAMFAHADRVSARHDVMPEELSEAAA